LRFKNQNKPVAKLKGEKMKREIINKLMKLSSVPQIFIDNHKIHDPVSFDYKIKKEKKVRTKKKQLALIDELKSAGWGVPYRLIISSWPTIFYSMETSVGLIWHRAKDSGHLFMKDLKVITPHNWQRSSVRTSDRSQTILIANLTQNSMPSEFSISRNQTKTN
jgi:hypothetical protein